MTLSYIVTIMNIPSNTVEKFGKRLKVCNRGTAKQTKARCLQSHSVIYYQVKMNFEDNIWTLTTTKPLITRICTGSTFMTLSSNMDKSCLALPLQLSFSSGSRCGYFDCVTIWGTSYQGMLNRF